MDFDPDKMQVIITNLLSNAIKFTEEQGEISVIVKLTNTLPQQLQLLIKDNGRGIADEDQNRIFDRFYQGNHPQNHQGQGTGVGLALVKELVELMGGHIKLKSQLGQGSSFFIYLPISKLAPASKIEYPNKNIENIPLPLTAASLHDSTEKRPLIQIVEDNRDVRYILQLCLQNNYQLLQAENGEEALKQLQTQQADLIISDIMMPKIDGYQFCEALKENPDTDHIPIILLTAKATQEDKNKGLSYGIDAYINKPFDKKELLIRVEQLLLKRKKTEIKFRQMAGAMSMPMFKNENPFLRNLTKILEQNYQDEDFSTAQICRLLAISKSKYYRELNKNAGLSPGQFIRSFRLQKAKTLLLNSPNLNMQNIAFQAGFRSLSYFSQEFKKAYECSPLNFRKSKKHTS